MFDDSAISPGVFEDYWQEQPYLITVSMKQIFCFVNVFTDTDVFTDDVTTKKEQNNTRQIAITQVINIWSVYNKTAWR